MFNVTSRYHTIAIAMLERPGLPALAYLRRRFVPQAGSITVLTEHQVSEGERLDNITARYLADPELFWRLCDANNALHPHELTDETSRWIAIPLPQ
jgi:hypothetical protein